LNHYESKRRLVLMESDEIVWRVSKCVESCARLSLISKRVNVVAPVRNATMGGKEHTDSTFS
jgi:hypothetical protein